MRGDSPLRVNSVGKTPRPPSVQSNVAYVAVLLLLLNLSTLYVFLQAGLPSRSSHDITDIRRRSEKQQEEARAGASLTGELPMDVKLKNRGGWGHRAGSLPSGSSTLHSKRKRRPAFHLDLPRSARVGWNATDNSFLQSLKGHWDVHPFSSQPGTYILQQTTDFSCAILIQDACYLYLLGEPKNGMLPMYNRPTGVWFSADEKRDLSKISFANDQCRLYWEVLNEVEKERWERLAAAGAGGGGGKGDGPLIQGTLEEDEGEEASHEPARGFLDEFNEMPHDVSDVKRRQGRSYGQFVGLGVLQKYINGSSEESRKELDKKKGGHGKAKEQWWEVGLVPRMQIYMGAFSEAVLPLLELIAHVVPGDSQEVSGAVSDPQNGDTGGLYAPSTLSVLFPGEKSILSAWTEDVLRQLLLPHGADLLMGREVGRKVCFRNLLLPVNRYHTRGTADLLRSRVQRLLHEQAARAGTRAKGHGNESKGGKGKGDPQEILPGSSILPVIVSRGDAEAESQEEGGGYERKTLSRVEEKERATVLRELVSGDQPLVTIVERETRGRQVNNVEDIFRAVQQTIPELPVVVVKLANASLADQALLFRNSVLTIGMHGSSLANVLFMPRGGVLLELLPYKFSSIDSKKIALRSGLLYLHWQNKHYARAHFLGNCFEKGKFDDFEDSECLRTRDCVYCIRDKSVTHVEYRELFHYLLNARVAVAKWLPKGTRRWRHVPTAFGATQLQQPQQQ